MVSEINSTLNRMGVAFIDSLFDKLFKRYEIYVNSEALMIFDDLKILRTKMIEKEVAVTAFRFNYNQKGYFVSICLLTDEDKKLKKLKLK